jgi:hypothetical protein
MGLLVVAVLCWGAVVLTARLNLVLLLLFAPLGRSWADGPFVTAGLEWFRDALPQVIFFIGPWCIAMHQSKEKIGARRVVLPVLVTVCYLGFWTVVNLAALRMLDSRGIEM